jgi:hypothetical protein
MSFNRIWPLAALASAGFVAGCSGGSGDPAQGGAPSSLSVSLMDAPVDGVTAVYVHITGVWLKPSGAGPAVELPLANGPRTVNLLELTDTNAALLVDDAPIEAGDYEWLAMDVSAEHDNVMDSYVTTDTGGDIELRVPSGRVRLVSGFTVGASQATRFLFDWDMRKGLVAPPGLPGYLLKPAFRLLDVTEYGILSGVVAAETITAAGCDADDPDLDVGNVVYVFAGAGATLDDVDGTDDPVATANVVPEAGIYSYRVALEAGDYTVAFTCQGASDEPETDEVLEFSAAVDVTMAGDAQTVDF